jgi:hypothetical protein
VLTFYKFSYLLSCQVLAGKITFQPTPYLFEFRLTVKATPIGYPVFRDAASNAKQARPMSDKGT